MIKLGDERLYRDTAYCLEYLRSLPPPAPPARAPRMPVHFFWRGALGRKPALALKSFLVTQDLDRLEPWLWLDGEGDDGGLPRVRVTRYEPRQLARATPLAEEPRLTEAASAVDRSDAFRLMVLHHHGGLYADIDTLFLRDLSVLLDSPLGRAPFCYRWSGLPDVATNAVLRMDAGSAIGVELMRRARDLGSCRGRRILRHQDHHDLDLLELPCPLFDPLWLRYDGLDRYRDAPFARFKDFFRPFGALHREKRGRASLEALFPGAFTYQWHGLWSAPEVGHSWFGLLEREVEQRFARRFSRERS